MKINFYVGFNNYYNRKVIVHDSLNDYQDKLLLTIPNVNFKPKDGVNAEQIVNTTQVIDSQIFNISNTPDYAIVADEDNTIISRWFVIEYESHIYKNQYRATLRRDVIADNYDAVINAPSFIEKATITNKNDVAIFNNENMGFNQIKTSETLLKDLTNCPWIVGFVPSNSDFHTNADRIIHGYYNGDKYTVYGAINLNNITDMPFKMFCMPYADLTVYSGPENDRLYIECDKHVHMAIASGIGAAVGSGSIFDVQLLPYCPLRTENGLLRFLPDIDGPEKGKYNISDLVVSYIKRESGNVNQGVIFWCDVNKFTFDIDCSLPLPSTALDIKVKNECDMYRLCSPNFNGQFEFNPMKNSGVTKINVDCMYQPFNSYIHLNPDFGKLYGSDFNDARGLICSGDFSLPQESNAWANYVQNNKNYQNMFDRQIQNMETMNKYQMTSQRASVVTGALQGAAGMGIMGGMLGGPVGAITGATGGGLASVIGGITDTIMLANQQKETLDYTKDQFDFNMANIKAMPNSVSKTNPFTNNNKIFPVLEYYTCTDKEKQALKDKMTYNGMTIGRIGKIKEWLLDDYSYIKGKLIMLDNDSYIEDDYHTVVEIAQELDKGIRVKKEA